jgi:hypothetical protein
VIPTHGVGLDCNMENQNANDTGIVSASHAVAGDQRGVQAGEDANKDVEMKNLPGEVGNTGS